MASTPFCGCEGGSSCCNANNKEADNDADEPEQMEECDSDSVVYIIYLANGLVAYIKCCLPIFCKRYYYLVLAISQNYNSFLIDFYMYDRIYCIVFYHNACTKYHRAIYFIVIIHWKMG